MGQEFSLIDLFKRPQRIALRFSAPLLGPKSEIKGSGEICAWEEKRIFRSW